MNRARIVLATINAGYAHASLGLRCLRANLGRLRQSAEIVEFDGRAAPERVAAALTQRAPEVLAFGVFIWNAATASAVLRRFRELCPQSRIVMGGPEVVRGKAPPQIEGVADCLIEGEGEIALAEVCAGLLKGSSPPPWMSAGPAPLERLEGAEGEYTDTDLEQRIVYLESSRGCPNACAYCQSAAAPGVRWRPLEKVEAAWVALLRRGARRLKIVDRTFNADEERAARLLRMIAAELPAGGSVQVEMTPEPPGPELQAAIMKFPHGALRVEVGVQTFDPAVARTIGRRSPERVAEALDALHRAGAVVHADLIAGLPGETPAGFAQGFDRLVAMEPEELQVNLLKLLRGTPLERCAPAWQMRFDAEPPYTVIETSTWPAAHLLAMRRFSRYWELLYNRGRFRRTLPLLWDGGASPFRAFWELSERLYARFGRSYGIAADDLALALAEHLLEGGRCGREAVWRRLEQDYQARGARIPLQRLRALRPATENEPTREGEARSGAFPDGFGPARRATQ